MVGKLHFLAQHARTTVFVALLLVAASAHAAPLKHPFENPTKPSHRQLAQRWTPMTGPVRQDSTTDEKEEEKETEKAKEEPAKPEPATTGPKIKELTLTVTLAEFPKSAGASATSPVDGRSRGWLGVSIQTLSEDHFNALRLKSNEGALIVSTIESSPAVTHGVLAGDIVRAVDGRQVRTHADLARIISSYRSGETVKIEIMRVGGGPEDLRERLKAEAEADNISAMYTYAKLSSSRTILKTDEQNASRFARKAAESDHIQAMGLWGDMLAAGYGTLADPARGADWYRKAADRGHVSSMDSLSNAYEHGVGVKTDKLESLVWARKAAEEGNANSTSRIARYYHFGTAVGKDLTVAAQWYEKAVSLNDSLAMNNLAVLYDAGTGVRKDAKKATELFQRASDLGNTTAMGNLAGRYDRGFGGVRRDHAEAVRLIYIGLKAADPVVLNKVKQQGSQWSPAFRKRLQQQLKNDGHYSGSIDGQLGPMFRRAVDSLASARRR